MGIFNRRRKRRELLKKIDKEVINISQILHNLIEMQASSSNGRIKIVT